MRRSPQLTLPFPADPPDAGDARAPRARAVERTGMLVERARGRWPAVTIPDPTVTFDLRGLAAGEACAESNVIRYNEAMLLRYGQDFLDEIVPHEVAHLVVSAVFGRQVRPHGGEWRSVMRFFGVPARRCHAFEAEPVRRGPRFAYRCECSRPHLLTRRAHLRIRRGTFDYTCRICGSHLVRIES